MKILLTLIISLLSTITHSQIYTVEIRKWSKYHHPGDLTLHQAILSNSVKTIFTKTGIATYTINFDTKEIVMIGSNNEIKTSKIVKIIPTKSPVNVDVVFDNKYYNFIVSENIDDKWSLIIRNFETENDMSVGFYCNDAKVSIYPYK